jgi:UDP-GlcNAc:undecaprenyl-phosphate/decaprenyl-phosphate GlcNAc-1-phosphate transferase
MTLIALSALPVCAAAIALLLRVPLPARLVAAPRGDRWHTTATPVAGGIGIYAGFLVGVLAALAAGAFDPSRELWGILGGVSLLFVAGLVDDAFRLKPLAKLAAQIGAAALVLGTGTHVEVVGNDLLAAAIGGLWLVGLTNAFNLLDNMDGLASTLAAIAAVYFAIDAVTIHPNTLALGIALALAAACAGFLPFNLRPGRSAAIFMGDSGSQMLGFALAALGLTSSWKVAGTTVATLILPLLVLAVPILDTALVTVMRLLEHRPVTQGGRDHSSHRLVRYGLSEKTAVLLLGLVAAALGATSLGYNVLDDQRVTLPGILLTFVVLVQFAGFLADAERRPGGEGGGLLRTFDVQWRRLVEVLVDFALISGSFLAAYLLIVGGAGSETQRYVFTIALPVIVAARYLAFIPFGLYRSVWRYAGARDLASLVVAVVVSEVAALAFVLWTETLGDFPAGVFVVDGLLCATVIAASRLAERPVLRALGRRSAPDPQRTLIVGAGRSGRSLHRELRETPGNRVVGYVDDNPRLRRRRLQGQPVRGSLAEIERILAEARPTVVLVTIPEADHDRLDAVVAACTAADVPCRFVRRETDLDPRVVLGAAAE